MVRPKWLPRSIPTIPSIEGYAIFNLYNVLVQIHEKHYKLYASGVAVQDDRRHV